MKTIIKTSVKGALLLSLLAISVANAESAEKDDTRPPTGCYNKGYQFELKTLHLMPGERGDNQSLYIIFNQLNSPITLYQMRDEDASRSTYLNHVIGAREWAVLSTSEKKVKFACTIPNPKSNSAYGQMVDCEQSLSVCEYSNVRYGLNNRGNYWLVNSSSRNSAVSAVVHYGIIPGQ